MPSPIAQVAFDIGRSLQVLRFVLGNFSDSVAFEHVWQLCVMWYFERVLVPGVTGTCDSGTFAEPSTFVRCSVRGKQQPHAGAVWWPEGEAAAASDEAV
jgi:hypothetical protein